VPSAVELLPGFRVDGTRNVPTTLTFVGCVTKHCRRLLRSKSRLRDESRLRDDGKVCGPRLNERCGADHSVQVFAGFHASLYGCDKGATS